MSKINTFKKLLHGDKRQILIAIYNNIVHTGVTNILSDDVYLRLTYFIRFGKKLNLNDPITFNEKMQWLKLYNHNKDYVKMVDKITVKKYVSKIINKDIVVPTFGIYDSFEEIDFNRLPQQFVLKCNHDSGSVVICKDKATFNKDKARKILMRGLKTNSFMWGREWPYKNVKRKILAEELLVDKSGKDVKDYKIMCFNGKVRCSFVCSERFSNEGLKVTFFDQNWNVMPFERHYPKSSLPIEKPNNYKQMVEIAEILSKGIPFVRVDFYEVNNKIYFGEMTFFPGSGWEEFNPVKWDRILGNWITLPSKK